MKTILTKPVIMLIACFVVGFSLVALLIAAAILMNRWIGGFGLAIAFIASPVVLIPWSLISNDLMKKAGDRP